MFFVQQERKTNAFCEYAPPFQGIGSGGVRLAWSNYLHLLLHLFLWRRGLAHARTWSVCLQHSCPEEGCLEVGTGLVWLVGERRWQVGEKVSYWALPLREERRRHGGNEGEGGEGRP